MGRWRAFLAVAVLIAGLSCGGSTPTAPAPGSNGLSAVASNYLNEILNLMEMFSINRARINWTDFRAQVLQRAQGAQTIPDTFPAISVALGLLDDHHSFYVASSGAGVGNPTGRRCTAPATTSPALPSDVGYVKVTSFSGSDSAASTAFADSIQDQIRRADRPSLVGWIVDVRGNTGGNMWPMVAGVGPVLGEGTVGFFVPPQGAPQAWTFQNGMAAAGGAVAARTTIAYDLLRRNPKVAVLTDGLVASSGEAVVVAFRQRPSTRSFGASTCGLSTSNASFTLSDRATLNLTTALMADRTQVTYGDTIAPDEAVSGDQPLVDRAIGWLHGL